MIENESFYGEEFFDLHGLNTAQKKAASQTEGYIRLTAGAGSGKTKTLATRFIYLTEQLGFPLDSVLCITFTRKAADEMRKRISDMSGSQAEGSLINTYQGFCHTVLREDIYRLHFDSQYSILDEDQQEERIREIYRDLGLKLRDGELKEVKFKIAKYKSYPPLSLVKNYIPEITINSTNDSYAENVKRLSSQGEVVAHYLARQILESNLDFLDLLNIVHYLFHHHVDVLEKWQERLQYIMIDEFQDSNSKELALIDFLSKKNKNLFVVGDPDQAIYSFKGGDIELFLNFPNRFPGTIDLFLNENYRSSHHIVKLSNEMIQKNKNRIDKASYPVKKKSNGDNFIGQKVTHFHGRYEKDEFEYISKEIGKLVQEGYQYKDIAVLVRSHRSKKPIEATFVKAGIPYTIVGGVKFYARSEIKVALSYVRMAYSNDNDAFILSINTPKRGIGEDTIKKIIAHSNLNLCSYYEALQLLVNQNSSLLKNTKATDYIKSINFIRNKKSEWSLSILVNNVIRVSGYYDYICEGANQDRLTNINDLIESVVLLEDRKQQPVLLTEYIIMIDELSRKADESEEKDELKIMTMHTSKGLEFKIVFLPCFNDKIIPSAKSLARSDLFEEERRLAYVAFTRAEELLYITETEARNSNGMNKNPSRFLFDFNREQINEINPIPESIILKFKQEYQLDDPHKPKIDILPNGTQFEHPTFGLCTITKFEDDNYYVDTAKKSGLRLSKNLPFLSRKIINLQQQPMVYLLGEDIFEEDEDDYKEKENPDSDSAQLAKPSEYESISLGKTPSVISTDGLDMLTQRVVDIDDQKPALNPAENREQTLAVQHHSWGIGFIESEDENYLYINFTGIGEHKAISKQSKSIKMILCHPLIIN